MSPAADGATRPGGPDLLVIGAGPAGLAAAATAAGQGARVTLVDANAAPGGQVWRAVESASPRLAALLGPDYAEGAAAVARLRASGAEVLQATTVWHLAAGEAADPRPEVGLIAGGRARLLRPARVLVATGAVERPMPVPGWTLPGVMTAGGA
ncbi:MAG: FAD-dependent oxidoreductase, partial [Pseudomonadota bacterium]